MFRLRRMRVDHSGIPQSGDGADPNPVVALIFGCRRRRIRTEGNVLVILRVFPLVDRRRRRTAVEGLGASTRASPSRRPTAAVCGHDGSDVVVVAKSHVDVRASVLSFVCYYVHYGALQGVRKFALRLNGRTRRCVIEVSAGRPRPRVSSGKR